MLNQYGTGKPEGHSAGGAGTAGGGIALIHPLTRNGATPAETSLHGTACVRPKMVSKYLKPFSLVSFPWDSCRGNV